MRGGSARTTARLLVVMALVLLALGAGTGASQAKELDRSIVPASRLDTLPFRGVTLVVVGSRVVCTGFVIGTRKVATAAHCLVRNAARGNYRFRRDLPGNVEIRRAFSQPAGGSLYRTCGAAKVWAHPRFIKGGSADRAFGDRAYDYAVITTPASCSYPRSAILRLGANEVGDKGVAPGKRSRLVGYPADPRFAGMNGLTLWRTEGRIQPTTDPRMLVTTGLVAQGMSGAPVLRTFGGGSPCGQAQCVVGLVTECQINAQGLCQRGSSPRRAVRITPLVKRTIERH